MIKNSVLNPFNKDAGIENYASFLRHIESNARNIFLMYSRNLIVNIELEMPKIFPISPSRVQIQAQFLRFTQSTLQMRKSS